MTSCPLCRADVEPGATECVACGATLVSAGGRVAVHVTAEFAVPQLPTDVSEAAVPGPGAGACAWCGRSAGDVRKLLGSGPVAICEGCVALCVDILDAELGPGWR